MVFSLNFMHIKIHMRRAASQDIPNFHLYMLLFIYLCNLCHPSWRIEKKIQTLNLVHIPYKTFSKMSFLFLSKITLRAKRLEKTRMSGGFYTYLLDWLVFWLVEWHKTHILGLFILKKWKLHPKNAHILLIFF